ncbi:hypothetical protein RPMA_17945 [Tardiphaga alba]|uniref:TonB-dependent receptor plug domain-containing protein n=1 Tax=Tardiphaga alba TaxID=340268 RepID=A0ABX8AFD1_9BRAD|nr:hypothetical protein RPMA_17945 [Tardiphaga alba]
MAVAAATSVIQSAPPAFAQAQDDRKVNFFIPAQPLAPAIDAFSRASGWQVGYSSQIGRATTTRAVSGVMEPRQALMSMLAGAGIDVRITGPSSAALVDPMATSFNQAPVDGSIVLDTIEVSGKRSETSASTPYETPAATSHITGTDIERYRGSSPSDIFRGTPGVMSGDSRNSAGGIDVNIRGLQGQGRVKVSVDDAENAVTVYHGYQGQSNRTYIDPDFIAGIDINKGLDVASRGAAGSVNMRTIGANDIVKPGDSWGIQVKGGFGTNTATPTPEAKGGYDWPNTASASFPAVSSTGLDRPGFLSPTSGSGSFAGAVKQDNWDFLVGYAYRNQGNYFAGKNGGEGVVADPVLNAQGVYVNNGFTNYRPGEEVLNTQLRTETILAKASVRSDDGQSLNITYNNYRGEGGYWLPVFGAMANMSQTKYGATTGTKIDSTSLRYRWNPDDNDLVDLKATAWMTYFQLFNDGRLVSTPNSQNIALQPWPSEIGLAENYRTGTKTFMWGRISPIHRNSRSIAMAASISLTACPISASRSVSGAMPNTTTSSCRRPARATSGGPSPRRPTSRCNG